MCLKKGHFNICMGLRIKVLCSQGGGGRFALPRGLTITLLYFSFVQSGTLIINIVQVNVHNYTFLMYFIVIVGYPVSILFLWVFYHMYFNYGRREVG